MTITAEGKRLYLLLTNQCNLNCKHCYLGDKTLKKEQLSWEQIKNALNFFYKKGFNTLEVTGGEPHLSPFFWQTIDLAKKIGYLKISVSTNGTFPQIMEQADPAKIDTFTFSLDGATKETNDFLRGKGHFEKCTGSIKKAIKRGFKTRVVFCLNKQNLGEAEKLANILDEMGVNRLSFNFTTSQGNAEINSSIIPTPSDWNEMRKEIKEIRSLKGLTLRLPYNFVDQKEYGQLKKTGYQCYIRQPKIVNIFPNGDIFYCCLLTTFKNLASGRVTDSRVTLFENKGEIELVKKDSSISCPAYYVINEKKQDKLIPICVYYKEIISPKSA